MGALSDGAKRRSKQTRAVSPVRENQVRENKRFAEECSNHGCANSEIRIPSAEINRKTYTVTPTGKPDQWSEDDQKRQAIAKYRASNDIVAIGPEGVREITKVAGESAKESRQLVNKNGVNAVWDWIFCKSSSQTDKELETALEETDESTDEPEFLTRAEQIRRDQAALKKSGDAIVDETEENPFKFFIFF